MATKMSTLVIFSFLAAITLASAGRIFNPGTNYEVDEDDIVTYLQLGQSCNPAIQKDNTRKEGICRATLYCNASTRTCECENIGPFKYTNQNGKCKNIIGSRCYKTDNCVQNAECVNKFCV